jgi:hypothetical protein
MNRRVIRRLQVEYKTLVAERALIDQCIKLLESQGESRAADKLWSLRYEKFIQGQEVCDKLTGSTFGQMLRGAA